MSMLTREGRIELLEDLRSIGAAGQADFEDLDQLKRTFYPVVEHLRAFDPEVVLVVGPRGSGKSELFRAVIDAKLLPAIARRVEGLRLPPLEPTRCYWTKGYPLGQEGFDVRGLRDLIDGRGDDPGTVRELWLAYLLRSLRERIEPSDQRRLESLFERSAVATCESFDALQSLRNSAVDALDHLDRKLEQDGGYAFVGYDELDTLGGEDWAAMVAGIRGLVSFWATYARRWRRVRAKVFLRSDLFDRHAIAGGADLAKLAANRVELVWNDRNLYGMLLKRLANASERMFEYVEKAAPRFDWRKDDELGHLPDIQDAADARPVVERMAGPFMGADVKKGRVHRWLLDHVRDGRARALPRPLVLLIENAARIQAESQIALQGQRLLAPSSLRRAVDDVSRSYVEYSTREWPWMTLLKKRLSGQLVPWEHRRDVERLLSPETLVPFEDSGAWLDYLIEVGVLRERVDKRIDAPDLFLAGLGLKRKGGVRRR